jgi:CheY-like chemotaxis protein
VLLVEDDVDTAHVVTSILELRGYRVVHAVDGVDALAFLQEGLRPAAIVLDLWMPNLDGRAFRSALVAVPELSDIPVVVYSVDLGADPLPAIVGHVRKGTDDPDVLLEVLAAACARGEDPGHGRLNS